LAAPKTKEEVLGQMRGLWLAFLASVPLYLCVGEISKTIPWLNFPNAEATLATLAVLALFSFLWVLLKRYFPALQIVRSQPNDMHAVRRWQVFWVNLLAIANCQILFGFVFWMGGKTFTQSAPFFVVGSLLLLLLWPRQVWSSAAATQ
jgi:hypothetical protein